MVTYDKGFPEAIQKFGCTTQSIETRLAVSEDVTAMFNTAAGTKAVPSDASSNEESWI